MLSHHLQTLLRQDGPKQDRGWKSFTLGDDIEHPMHAVGEVHVSVSGWSPHRSVARCAARTRMTPLVFGAYVGFGLDDYAGQSDAVLIDPHHSSSK
jgi:hypothetical protein